MGQRAKPDSRKIVGAVCYVCGRQLMINHHDDPVEAMKRNRWSNITASTKPPQGHCRCRHKQRHRG